MEGFPFPPLTFNEFNQAPFRAAESILSTKMSRETPIPPGSSLEAIFQLQDQVKGLMETTGRLHELYNLDALNIPMADQYVRAGHYTLGDMYDRMPGTNPMAETTPMPETNPMPTTNLVTKAAPPSNISEPQEGEQNSAPEVSSLAPYEYTPLNAKCSEIRLLALKAGTSVTDPISCRLIAVSLDDIPDYVDPLDPKPVNLYTPLSYCWGTTAMTENIIVDGQSFLVTPSLHGALLHFRSSNQDPPDHFRTQREENESYWWIDAICINQNDVDERNSQVGLMTRLYKQSNTVHVWLGEESDDSARAMKVIRELAYLPTSEEEWKSSEYIPKRGQTHRPDGPGQPMVKLPLEPAAISAEEKEKNYKALISLYQRPWWSRVWIRQEVALPDNVKFHCGTDTCTWEEMMRTADILTYLLDECHVPGLSQEGIRSNGVFASCFKNAGGLNRLRESMNRDLDEYAELQPLVLESRDCQATDPRDKIFAMLPLTNPDVTEITADYRKDPHEVYKEVALNFITNRLDYLAGCQNFSRSNGLPSWVPNLEEPWKPSLVPVEIAHPKSLEEDWGNPPPDLPEFTYVPEHSRLDVQGVIFDEIKTINYESDVSADTSNEDLRAATSKWREFYESHREEMMELWMEEDEWDKRDDCTNMFDHILNDDEWNFLVLQNTDGDQERRYASRDVTRFSRWEENVDHDPTLKTVRRLLPSDDTPYSKQLGQEDEYFATLRPLAVGRRVAITSKGAMVLVAADASAGDEICFFDGSSCPFIIRKAENDAWVMVGQACKLVLDISLMTFLGC